MDPNETLRRLRSLLGGDHSGYEDQQDVEGKSIPWGDDWLSALCEAEELWQALDGWISKGGFLPDGWEHQQIRSTNR